MKLGHPVPDSNLSAELNSGSPDTNIHVNTRLVVVPEFILERRLGRVFAGHFVLQRRQLSLQFLILGFGIALRLVRFFRKCCIITPDFFDEPVPTGSMTVSLITQGALFKEILMVVLRLVERGQRNNGGDDRSAETPRTGQLRFRRLCLPLLLLIVIKDGRAVLRPPSTNCPPLSVGSTCRQ